MKRMLVLALFAFASGAVNADAPMVTSNTISAELVVGSAPAAPDGSPGIAVSKDSAGRSKTESPVALLGAGVIALMLMRRRAPL